MRLAAVLIWLAMPLAAQDGGEAAARQIIAAQDMLAAAASAQDQVAALTQTIQAYETGLVALRQSLREITAREATLSQALTARHAALADLLMVLSRIGQSPRPVTLANPAGAVGAVRAGMLLADLTPQLSADVQELQAELSVLGDLRARQTAAEALLRDGHAAAQTARAALGQAISNRADVPRRFIEDPVQTAQRVAAAQTLAALANDLAAQGLSAGTVLTPAADLPLPVAGIITTGTRERPGITIAAAPRALVTAPVRGTILYRGPLLDYGNVVILEPAADLLFVFAGMAETFGQTGEIVEAGAPLGLMGGDDAMNDTNLMAEVGLGNDPAKQPLYLEVRGRQASGTPDAWFALE